MLLCIRRSIPLNAYVYPKLCRTDFYGHLVMVSIALFIVNCSDVIWPSWYLKSLAILLFVQFVQANNKYNIKAPYYWPFGRGILWWQVDSPHKRPVLRKTFPWMMLYDDDISIVDSYNTWALWTHCGLVIHMVAQIDITRGTHGLNPQDVSWGYT